MPTLKTLIQGRSDLSGPLAQLGLGRDGTYYVIAAGRCNHAGIGAWKGVTKGNSSFIGIEAENTGLADDSPCPRWNCRTTNMGCSGWRSNRVIAGDRVIGPGIRLFSAK